MLQTLKRFVGRHLGPPRTAGRSSRKYPCRPRLEALEDRRLLANLL